jgi:hypothetical protein
LTAAAPALVFGVVGWLGGNALVLRLLSHQHAAEHGMAASVPHVHDTRAAAMILAGCLLLAAGLAVTTTLSLRRTTAGLAAFAASHRAGMVSTAGFLLAEVAQHGVSGDQVVPTPVILVLGALVQTLIGTGGSILWQDGLATLNRRAATLRGPTLVPETPPLRARVGRIGQLCPRWATVQLAGRAPPVCAA